MMMRRKRRRRVMMIMIQMTEVHDDFAYIVNTTDIYDSTV
jgi:hypothetical protein